MKDFLKTTVRAFENYLREKMTEKEKKGYIISREIIEEIIEELKDSIENKPL